MGYHLERRQAQENQGYARFSIPPTAKEKLAALLRNGDRIYEDGTVIAPVANEAGVQGLVSRIERALETHLPKPRFIPKEKTIVIGDFEIHTDTKEAYLHSDRPLSRQEIAERLKQISRQDPCALAHVDAIYAQTNERAAYFTTHHEDGEYTLVPRIAPRDLTSISLLAALYTGPVVCPVSKDQDPCYHPATKTLSIKTGKQ